MVDQQADGRQLDMMDREKDRYRRTIGELSAPRVERVSVAMVEARIAWHFVKYAPGDSALATAEASARARKRGLWVDPAAVALWVWRKR